MRIIVRALICASLAVSTASNAETAPVSSKSIQLSKVVINPEVDAANQHIKVGTICLFAGRPLDFGANERTLNYERFERIFSAKMKELGYNAIAKSSDLFEGQGDQPGPDFLIGATLRPTYVKMCDSIDGQKGTILISVEWKIYDRTKKQVVEVMTTEGRGDVPNFLATGLTTMTDQAFSNSLNDLIGLEGFQKQIGKPEKTG